MKKSFSLLISVILLCVIAGLAQNVTLKNEDPDTFRIFKNQLLSDEAAMPGQSQFYKNTNTPTADFGDAPEWDWAEKFDGSGHDIVNDAVTDGDGNIYVAGSFSGTMDFAGTSLISVGKRDVFIAKFDVNSDLVWIKQGQCGAFNSCEAYDIELLNNKLLITGYFDGPSFTIDEASVSLTGYSDAFILQLSVAGTIDNLHNYGAIGFLYRGLDVEQGNDQNIYLTGTTDGNTSYFHPSFLLKIAPEGNVLWQQDHNIAFNDIAISSEQLYVAGSAYTDAYLDDILLEPGIYADAFVARANLMGQYEWAVMGEHEQEPWGDSYMPQIEIGTNGDVFMAGYFRNNVEFGQILLSTTSMDAFLVRITPNAEVLWANATIDTYNSLDAFTLLENDRPCISGGMGASAMFDDIEPETPNGGAGNYVAIYNSSGVAQNAFVTNYPSSGLSRRIDNSVMQTGTTGLDSYISEYHYTGSLIQTIMSSGNSGTGQLTGLEVDNNGLIYSLSNQHGYTDYFGVEITNQKENLLLTGQKPNGDVLWVINMEGGISWWNFTETTLKLDQTHNKLFLHGIFNDTLKIGGLEFINQVGGAFMASYSKTGDFLWAKEIPYDVDIQSVDTDIAGNVYFVLGFLGTIEIEGQTFTSYSDGDALVLKYSGGGNFIYAKQIKTDVFFYQISVACIQSGGYFVTVEPAGDSIFFNNGNNTMVFTPNDGRCVVAKYTDNGDYLWAKSFGYSPASYGGYFCWPTASVTDDDGNLYLTGTHGDSAMFDNIMLRTPYNRYSPFTAKIDTDGNALWANSIQIHQWGSNYCEAEIDNEGNFYCMGDIRDTIHFANWQYVPVGPADMYVTRYDNDGEIKWVKTIESTSSGNHLYGMGVYEPDNLFVGGNFTNRIYTGDQSLITSSSMAGLTIHVGDSIVYSSIDEEGNDQVFVTAYPNPTNDIIYLDFKTPAKMAVVEFLDINGRLIKNWSISSPSATEKLDLNGLPKGTYLMKITTERTSASHKIIIQ